ncbi:MAG: YdeI/OmpD-associated family protein [Chloroflexota bacterium]|nr:YdeI/OmpD-associated family protein [Chloroflexota bacterium]
MNNDRSRRLPLTFRATLQGGDSGAFVEVPPEVLEALGPSKRPAVRVVINGVELRTTLAAYAGRSQIGLRREIREAARVHPDESIEVRVELDTEPRSVEVPEDLAAALLADPTASGIFEGLSFTNRKEYVAWVVAAKTPATRQRRVAEAPELLKSGRRTPLGK